MNSQDIRLKRAYYRACHRGTKEMDWMLGRFASAALEAMPEGELAAFEAVLALPDPIIDAMLKGAEPADPAFIQILKRIKLHHGLAA